MGAAVKRKHATAKQIGARVKCCQMLTRSARLEAWDSWPADGNLEVKHAVTGIPYDDALLGMLKWQVRDWEIECLVKHELDGAEAIDSQTIIAHQVRIDEIEELVLETKAQLTAECEGRIIDTGWKGKPLN